jgi:hypothetical protein
MQIGTLLASQLTLGYSARRRGDRQPRIPAPWNRDGTQAAMKDIFVVDSYAQSHQHVDMLSAMVDHLTKANQDICLVSHLPIPERLVNPNVKFVCHDSNNILGPNPMALYFKHQDLEIRCYPTDFYHGPAVYSNLHNALTLLAHRYNWVHFVESDIDFEAIQRHLEGGFATLKNRHDVKVIGYPFDPDDPALRSTAILTSLFSLRPEIVEFLPRVTNWNEYDRLCQNNTLVLEAWLLDLFKARKIQYALLDDMKIADKSHLGGDFTVIKCRQNDPLFTIFVINQSRREIDAQGPSGTGFRLKPGQLTWFVNVTPSDEVLVSYVGSETIYRHPLKTMRLGAFRKQGVDLCPDWIE